MNPIPRELAQLFTAAIRTAIPAAGNAVANVTMCGKNNPGHYQCNAGLQLFSALKGKPDVPKNPKAFSEAIMSVLAAQEHPMIGKLEITGPGFISVHLRPEFIEERIRMFLQESVPAPEHPRKKVIVDFSSPNIAKEMHVGHLRSTIIGDTLCRVLEFVGHDVKRINHVGDWGTQFGMLIAHLKDKHADFLDNPPNIGDLQAFYKESKKRFDEDADFKARAHQEVVKLQSGDAENLKAWQFFCKTSRDEFQKIYDRLDVVLEEKGESFYNPLMPSLVEELSSSGLVQESQGAMCFFIPNADMPLMMRKSDGGFTYDTTDMAAIRYRLQQEQAEWLIYVTDAGQAPHFDLIFKAAQMSGWVNPEKHRIDHVGFGVVLGEDGKKFKTRSGDTVRLVDLLDEARDRCKKELLERQADIPAEDIDPTAEALGYGAVKYFDLNKNRNTNYQFSYDQMCDLRGNTAVYLLYSHARVCSIFRKAGVSFDDIKGATLKIQHPSELALALHMMRFPEVVNGVLEDLMPNRLTDFLYELTCKFSDFYRDCRVMGDENETSRLLLCESVARLMRLCFKILGIRNVYRL